MSKKRVIFISVFAALVLLIAVFVGVRNFGKTAKEGEKSFTIEIKSERDSLDQTEEYHSTEETLGAFLRTMKDCNFREDIYGLYIEGFSGYLEDLDNQYWWMISVNDESATLAADEILLEDGAKYSFTLKQGW